MLFLKTLYCLKGHDSGRRFLLISIACYFLLILLSPILSRALLILFMLLITLSPILLLAAFRRVHDAGFATPLAVIPLIVYWLNVSGIAFMAHPSKWGLLVIGVITTLIYSTMSNARMRRTHQYVFGYSGPINVLPIEENTLQSRRVEPTIAGQKLDIRDELISNDSEINSAVEQIPNNAKSSPSDRDSDINQAGKSLEEKVGLWIKSNKRLSASMVAILILTVLFGLSFALSPTKIKPENIEEPSNVEVRQRLHKIELPDQFWLIMDQYDAVTIAWEGDYKSEKDLGSGGNYWSPATAIGDKDCTDLRFSLGDKIRTINVSVKAGGDYYADFSPVDSQLIVQSIADKDRFRLCGYEFELKGTRSVLRKNDKYRQYLNQ